MFWVDVDSPPTAQSDFIIIAKMLGGPAESIDDGLRAMADTKNDWLLILDSADDPNFNYNVYFPSGTRGAVIMTSRVAECSDYNTVGSESLSGLDAHHSAQLLLKAAKIPEKVWASHDQEAKDVITLLGSHTLAVIHAGAYIASGHCRLNEYSEVYRREGQRLFHYHPRQAESRYRDVYATLEASAQVLERSDSQAGKDALALLGFLSMTHYCFLPLQVFKDAYDGCSETTNRKDTSPKHCCVMRPSNVSLVPDFIGAESKKWDSYRLIEAILFLASLSLITKHGATELSGISLHPLTHVWTKDRLDQGSQDHAWIAAASVLAMGVSSQRGALMLQPNAIRPHFLSLLNLEVKKVFSLGSVSTVLPIFIRCLWALPFIREKHKLGPLVEETIRCLEIDPEIPSVQYLTVYELWSYQLADTNDHERAVALLEKVINIRKATLPDNNRSGFLLEDTLAHAHVQLWAWDMANALLEHIAEIESTLLQEADPNRLGPEFMLANYLRQLNYSNMLSALKQL